jgi:hypothetical protein
MATHIVSTATGKRKNRPKTNVTDVTYLNLITRRGNRKSLNRLLYRPMPLDGLRIGRRVFQDAFRLSFVTTHTH